jgi:hypothetical protein
MSFELLYELLANYCFEYCVSDKFIWGHYLLILRQFQWPRCLKHDSAAARLLGLRVRISPGARLSVFCDCCVLSGRVLCVGLITRPEETYRVWLVWMWSWSLDNVEALDPLESLAPWKEELLILQLHVWVLFLVEFKFKILKIVAHAVRISDLLYLLLLYMK